MGFMARNSHKKNTGGMHFCKRKRLCTPLLEAGHSHRVRTACRPAHPRALWAGASATHVEVIFFLCTHLCCAIMYTTPFS